MRFSTALGNHSKVTFPALPAQSFLLERMAVARGISRAELLRRITARAILDDPPDAVLEINPGELRELEYLADL